MHGLLFVDARSFFEDSAGCFRFSGVLRILEDTMIKPPKDTRHLTETNLHTQNLHLQAFSWY